MSETLSLREIELQKQVQALAPQSNLESLADDRSILEEIAPDTDALAQSEEEAEAARQGYYKLSRGESAAPEESDALEAIILPQGRPVIDIRDNTFEAPRSGLWLHLGETDIKSRINSVIPSVGRVELPGNSFIPYGGTAFVVGEDLLMTNRHVAELFSQGLGRKGIRFRPGSTSQADFREEVDSTKDITVDVVEVVMIHPYWDMALLKVSHLPANQVPLVLSTKSPDALEDQEISLIGYPAFDPRNDVALQNRIFGGVFNVKRLMPGTAKDRKVIRSFGNQVKTLTHDASSLGGASGSPTIELATGEVVGLHFAGIKRRSNYAVPTYELARDPYVVEAGVNFSGSIPGPAPAWWAGWRALESNESTGTTESEVSAAAPAPRDRDTRPALTVDSTGAGVISLTVPLNIQISLGEPSLGSRGAAGADQEESDTGDISTEAPRTIPDPDYSNRKGYDPEFLGENLSVPVPWLSEEQYGAVAHNRQASSKTHLLPYHHFSLCMNGDRGIAFYTAVNVDGEKEMEIIRNDFSDFWGFDPRIDESLQLGNDFYKKSGGVDNPLDRGHLVRRLDPCWGETRDEVIAAHHDTFHYTNSSPQHKDFNRNTTRWLGVENYILKNANTHNMRVSVLSGPVLKDDDPLYATPTGLTVQLPVHYWKIVAFLKVDGSLSTSAYLLSQEAQIDPIIETFTFGNFKDYRTSVKHLEELTGYSFGNLSEFDQMSSTESIGSPLVPYADYSELNL